MTSTLRDEWIQQFGEAYQVVGLPRLMGNVVGLLLAAAEPLSLDSISEELGMSKGPVSQVMTRLRENRLVVRQKLPGDRKDYYSAVDDIFGQAFANHTRLFRMNFALADEFARRAELPAVQRDGTDGQGSVNEAFTDRIHEMRDFYSMALTHMNGFLDAWAQSRAEAANRASTSSYGERA